jgi:DNA-binding response OmpR family regulator
MPSPEPNKQHVLVVDDDSSLVRLLHVLLASEGYDVATADNGKNGLDKLTADGFDLIILDLQMPVLDGKGFYKQMRELGYKTPVLILSAYGGSAARNELKADAVLTKPFEPDELLDKVHDLLPQAA